jgi:hypothetical protein
MASVVASGAIYAGPNCQFVLDHGYVEMWRYGIEKEESAGQREFSMI